ncbi:MAG TPA: phosphotransferase [Streptosporangiaceae bacterium]|nr:phosphotransferase [Streptosporangiaceae bacterium]
MLATAVALRMRWRARMRVLSCWRCGEIQVRARPRCAYGEGVLAPPEDLTEAGLAAALDQGWGLTAAALAYRPVGWGSHHWELTDDSGTRWFVTVDDLSTRLLRAGDTVQAASGRLRASLAAASALRDSGREFVVAPVPARSGEPVQPAGERFPVAVYPLIEGESFTWGGDLPDGHARAVLDMVIGVHTAPAAVAALARADDFWIPQRDELEAALAGTAGGAPAPGPAGAGPAGPDGAAGCGPYAAAARDLLAGAAGAVTRQLRRYDKLVALAAGRAGRAVLTHGEPHPGNTMRTPGGWRLIDWDTVLVAPPERDLWDTDPGDGSLLASYAAATGVRPDPDLLELYRVRWDLSDLALGVRHFRRPHGRSPNDEKEWGVLQTLIDRVTA